MSERRTIPRRETLPTALDWAKLRAEGLAHIQRLSRLVWTDHNSHDPGITTLEVLAYALTDLAYRMGFPTVDLLTRPDGTMAPPALSGLAPAHEALTTAPRTIADYRRLLLRIEGLSNAWLDPMQDPADLGNFRRSEVALFADCGADALTYSATNAEGEPNHPVRLSGLWRVLVELEIDDLLGSMNSPTLPYTVRRGPLKGAVLALDCGDPAFFAGEIDFAASLDSVDAATLARVPLGFAVALDLTVAGAGRHLEPCLVRVVEDRPRFDRPSLTITDADVMAVVMDGAADGLVPLFWEKQASRAAALARVAAALHAHRGLCEDFLSIETVAPFPIGICADIEVTPAADLEAVQAEVFRAIERYLAPPVRYRTLEEMLADGVPVETIWNGPFVDFTLTHGGAPLFTKPGFITDDDLAATELRRRVQASDIINIIVDVAGVEAVRNLRLQAYGIDGLPLGAAEKWTLAVAARHQPVFDIAVSKILFHKAGIPYRAQATEFQRTLEHLRALDRHAVYVPPDQVLPEPRGRWRNLDAFHSVQHDFPETYRIGPPGIAPSEGDERIASARQFKGYLTFFDQMLADYLGQLANLRRLYSLDNTLDRAWFSRALSGMAGSLGDFETEFLTDPAAYADDLARSRLTETEEAFLDRRSRLLDHLIARFAERFADYAFLQFRLSGDRIGTTAEIIADKLGFLAEYPRLSRNRGQAANIRPEDAAAIWDSDNVSGLERRAGRLLGIDDLTRRDLHCAGHAAALFGTLRSGDVFRVTIRAADGALLFSSAETFPDAAAARAAGIAAYDGLREEAAFEVAETQGATTFTLAIVSGPSPLTHNRSFDTEAEAFGAARAIVDRYDALLHADACDSEGLHLIEHILLRPRVQGNRLMQVCLAQDCAFCGEEDPYSFRVSAVLPYWPERFRNLAFRALVERTLREEAPAHVQVRVCWIGQRQMAALDRAYRVWLTALAGDNAATLATRAAALIEVLERLVSVYPAASLHDCDVGEDENQVRLGATALGIF
jgi:hypothetical protein